MSRLSLLILLVATICFSTINAEAQRQLRAASLDDEETRRQLQDTISPSTADPTEGASTDSPMSDPPVVNKAGGEEEATASPTEADSTATPTEADSTVAPTEDDATEGPTEADSTVAPTDLTAVPTMDETFAPTEGDCAENPATYEVMVDLQATYFPDTEEQDRKCSTAEDGDIAAAISAALNSAFPLKVTNWDGDAKFGDFGFDDQQTYDDISELTGMRQLRGRTSRREAVMTCPLRGNLPCASGYCMWGCLNAATTNCGDDDSTELWANMAEDVKNQLIALATENGRGNSGKGFDCLGNLEEMMVIVTLDAGVTDAPSVAPTEPEEVRTVKSPTAAPTFHFADEGAEVPITTIMELDYFDNNHGGELDKSSGVALQLMKELSMFIESILWNHPVYGDHFNGMAEAHLDTQWLEDTKTLKLTFSTVIYFTSLDAATDTDKSLAHTITTEGDFHQFIKELRQHKCKDGIAQEDCGKFMSGIKRVSFAGTGTGR